MSETIGIEFPSRPDLQGTATLTTRDIDKSTEQVGIRVVVNGVPFYQMWVQSKSTDSDSPDSEIRDI